MSDDEPEQENYKSDDSDSDTSQHDVDEAPKPRLIIGEAIQTNNDKNLQAKMFG